MTEHDMDPAELVEKALLVKNLDSLVAALQISESELPDKLTIHFQRKSNYGGDVQEVIYPLNFFKKDAIVIFADAKDMLSAAQHEHVFRLQHEQMFKSHPLTVTRLPPVFTSVEAKIDPLYFNIMPFDAPAEFSKRVGKHSNVKVDKTNIGKITCSHPSQLKFVEREVCGLVMNRAADSVSSEDDGFEAAGASNLGFKSSLVQRGLKKQGYDEDDEMEVADQNEEGRITGRFSKQSDEPEMFSSDHSTSQMQLVSREEHDDKSGKKHSLSALNNVAFRETDVDNVGRFKTMDNLVVLDKSTYEYLVKFEDSACSRLLKRNKAQIQVVPGHDNNLEGFVFPSNPKTSAENVSKAKDEFISLYQKLHFDLERKTIDCSSADAASIRKATEETLRQFKANTLITKVDGSPNLRLVLRRGDVEEVARQFRKIAGIKSGKTLRNPGAGVHGTEATSTNITKSTIFGEESPEVRASAGQQSSQSRHSLRLKSGSRNDDMDFTTNEGMHIAIRTGDITKLSASAVVCPSDPYLTNERGGVAKAILDAAGFQLRGHCQEIMKERGNKALQMAECVVSRGLNLQYNAVIHVCGPSDPYYQQQFKSDLYCSFLNCLRTAQWKNMSSLAMPLIGSGAIGAAKTLCADALAQALINFSRESGGSKFVKEVFLVNIDKDSSKAIQQSLQTAFSLLDDATLKAGHVGGSDRSAAVGSGVSQSTYTDQRTPTRIDLDMPPKSSGSHHSASDVGNDKWLDKGESKRQGKKERHGIDTKPENQHLTEEEWPTPRESKEKVKENHKNPLGGNAAADDEAYGNRGASHVNPADKSVRSTGDQGGPLDAKTPAESADDQKDVCPICLADKMIDAVALRCKHRFCKNCIDQALKNNYKCPVCQAVCSQPKGNQPDGTMRHTVDNYWHLPGYEKDGVITIHYYITGGTQSPDHPNPGKYFKGVTRTAYLPDNPEGREVLGLLRKAFDARLVFTVGRSVTSGEENIVTWNDIHHKTSRTGGPHNYGYPDPGYLKRVKEDLAAKGIQ